MTMTRREAIRHLAGVAGCGVLAAVSPGGLRRALAQSEQRLTVERAPSGPGPDGAVKQGGMFRVNGTLPGPVLRFRQGEEAVVRVVNSSDRPTSIHWHGMTQQGTWWMDGVAGLTQDPIPPGGSFVYRFKADPGGTHLWHSHFDMQYSDGIQGMFIVEESENPYQRDYDSERVLLVQDWFHRSAADTMRELEGMNMGGSGHMSMGNSHMGMTMDMSGSGHTGMGMDMTPGKVDYGDVPFRSALINGKGRVSGAATPFEAFQVRRGERVRFRLANLGSTYAMKLRMDGHRMTVIASDGAFTQAKTVESLVLDIGERYDVIVEMDQPEGNYWVRANTLEEGVDHGVRAVLRYEGAPDWDPAESPPEWGETLDVMSLKPWKAEPAPAPDITSRHVLAGSMHPYLWTWDGRRFQLPGRSLATDPGAASGIILLDSPQGKVMRLILDNNSDMFHPFHKHGSHFQLLGAGRGGPYNGQALNEAAPLTKDTISVPPRGWAVIQWKEDNPGFWFFHCHVEWHMEAGMAVVVKSGEPPRPPSGVGK